MADTSVSSQSSEVTAPDLSSFLQQDHEICSLEFLEKEYMSTEWTDEKHSLYLKSIETSFVHQLYRSINSNGLHSQSQSKHSSHVRSSKQKTSRAADQRMKLERGEPPPQKPRNSCIILQNPWNHHFKSKDDQPIPASASFRSEPVRYVHTLSNTSDNFRVCQTTRDSSIEGNFSRLLKLSHLSKTLPVYVLNLWKRSQRSLMSNCFLIQTIGLEGYDISLYRSSIYCMLCCHADALVHMAKLNVDGSDGYFVNNDSVPLAHLIEHSGQNFDEEEEDETLCCMHSTKRMKIVEAATENQE